MMSALVWMNACAQAGKELVEGYYLKVGNVTMSIDAARGAKIMSLKYGEQEVISQLPWPEAFGSTFWTSPQKEWNWPPVPEFDKQPYSVEQHNGTLVMTSPKSEKLGFRIRKEFTTDEKDEAFVITYCIINESSESRQVAPWEITRVPNEGVIYFDAPLDGITPAGLMLFRAKHEVVCYQADVANENRKINADGKGWLAYANHGLLLVKRFDDLTPNQPAPNEAEIQVYVNRGKTYIELESQGAYTTLKPGEQLRWTVRWNLLPLQRTTATKETLILSPLRSESVSFVAERPNYVRLPVAFHKAKRLKEQGER